MKDLPAAVVARDGYHVISINGTGVIVELME